MAENLILNGKTYSGAKVVIITNDKGEQVAYFHDAVRTVNGQGPDDDGNVEVGSGSGVNSEELDAAVEEALREAKDSGAFDGESVYVLSIEESDDYQEGQIVLGVEKIVSNTYANETAYLNEEFILLRVWPKTNGTVSVTYGGLTKTFTDTSGEESPPAIFVFFGTFNGASDEVATPQKGRLTIEGDYNTFGCGTFYASEQDLPTETEPGVETSTSRICNCIIAVMNCGHIRSIPGSAFRSCTKLTNIVVPEGVTNIGPYAFAHCTNIENVKLPESLTEISIGAFAQCMSLTNIVIPESVTTIYNQAFTLGSGYSRKVIMKPTTPPTLMFMGLQTFHQLGANKIIVPYGCAEAYKTASYWSRYADYIAEGDVSDPPIEDYDGSYTRVYFSDGSVLYAKNGETPYIGENGNWWVGYHDTGVKAAADIVQTTGDSPDKVMSQKAVTEKFESYGIYVENGYLCMEV